MSRMWLVCPAGEPQFLDLCGGPNPNLVKGYCPWCEGNPINAVTGNKTQFEQDYAGQGGFPLVFIRTYNSWGSQPGALMGLYSEYYVSSTPSPNQENSVTSYTPVNNASGVPTAPTMMMPMELSPIDKSWRHNYDRSLNYISTVSGNFVQIFRGDSKSRTFSCQTTICQTWKADPGQLSTKLTETADSNGNPLSWAYVNENDETELYNANGELQSITNRAGLTQTLQYVNGYLASVTDPYGHQMTFTYNGNNLASMTTPNGEVFRYNYDGNGNLATVTYPDGAVRQYLYENPSFVTALTGIVDENGSRYATWAYDGYGNAINSQHVGGVESVTLSFPSATATSATDVGGATRAYTSILSNDITLATVISESGAGITRTMSMGYDGNGNVIAKTDYNGNTTTHSYDTSRDLELTRTEAYNTPLARTITTQWHPTFRLPAVITEPGRITTNNYDSGGNLLSKTVTANGSSRTWSYTYNNGLMATATNPRTDVNDTTAYGYDASGNLTSITNALSQVTTFSNYDGNGRVGLITDPNGQTTALTYSPRGWLMSRVVTAGNIVQTTSYTYDAAGQLTQVILPDSTTIGYTYDAAHRLTTIKDNLGDSITYTLDIMSNRTGEAVKDPGGVLTRQVSRVFDTLNRVTQVTGAAQ